MSYWAGVAAGWLAGGYLAIGLWVALKRPDWESGVQFHSRHLPLPRTHPVHTFLAGLAQFLVIVVLWPFYGRARMPFYQGEDDPPEVL